MGHLERQSFLAIYSSLPLDASGVIADSPGHWDTEVPTPELLGSVESVLHRLQTAFQEALDLYRMVSQGSPGQGGTMERAPCHSLDVL